MRSVQIQMQHPLAGGHVPRASSKSTVTNMSTMSRHATALEVCDFVYGDSNEVHAAPDDLDRFYETSASEQYSAFRFHIASFDIQKRTNCFIRISQCEALFLFPLEHPLMLLFSRLNSYENPLLTATSREIISDIHALSRQLSEVDIPRPLAMLCTLFGARPPDTSLSEHGDTLFQAMRVWTEIGDISESESFGEVHPCTSRFHFRC
jgi:hypothetical protein